MHLKKLCLFVMVAAALTAQEPGRDTRPGGGMMRFHPMLAAIDADHDGVISAAELDNAAAALKALDKNGDGQLSMDEIRPNFGPGRGMGGPGGPGRGPGTESAPSADSMVSTLMAFDKNGDGKLSKDELPERMQGMLERGDTDKDGFLSKDEIVQMASAQQARSGRWEGRAREGREASQADGPGGRGGPGGPVAMRMDPVMAALDTDRDGVLSATEIANAKVALLKLDRNGDGKLTEDEVRPNFRRGGPAREGAVGRQPERQ